MQMCGTVVRYSITVEMTYVSSKGVSSCVLTPNRALKGHTRKPSVKLVYHADFCGWKWSTLVGEDSVESSSVELPYVVNTADIRGVHCPFCEL